MDCTPIFSSENTPSVSVCKTWRIHMHTLLGQFHLHKSLSVIVPNLQNPSSPLWPYAICVLWFVISPHRRFIMSSWQRISVPVFVFPCARLPSFPSQIQTQFVVFWRVFMQVILRRKLWQSISFDWEFIIRWDLTGCKSAEQRFSVPVFRTWSEVWVSF